MLRHVNEFFGEKSPLRLMRMIASLFDRESIPYCVSSGVAFAVLGVYTVVTTDLEFEVAPERVARAKELVRGIERTFGDTNPVSVRPWVSGNEFTHLDGIRYRGLRPLIDSCFSVPQASSRHLRCWSSALTAIRDLRLPREYALQLNPIARVRYEQLWDDCGGPEGMEKARDHACLGECG